MDESRVMRIYFGTDWGCCQVSLGETKVLAQVSCEVQKPKTTRPNEGMLFLNTELSPMGSPHFEVGLQSELAVQLNRLLEKCIKDSRCVDLESLCIVAEEKVWVLRVDINVLNHEGNLVAAASAAALTALSHFRCPCVTVTGQETVIHDPSEKDAVPLNLHHYPVCVSYAIFNKGEHIIADPTAIEERVSEAQVVFGVNAYRELCGLHLGGSSLTSHDLILQCANRAARRAAEVVQIMKLALKEDADARAAGKSVGFSECIQETKLLALSQKQLGLQLDTSQLRGETLKLVQKKNKHIMYDEKGVKVDSGQDDRDEDVEVEPSVILLDRGSAELLPKQKRIKTERTVPTEAGVGEGGQNQWMKIEGDNESLDESDEVMSSPSDVEVIKEVSYEGNKLVDSIELSGDSEEEETVVLNAADVNMSVENTDDSGTSENIRNWYPVKQW
ncbi:hypothetical protein B7P43_G15566 [Cryptotermes secundus]|nr:exosome complex component RRP45 isoform X2 [Cryptotermes secundus]PNF15123.1 hypothetical protein B7P43_G15566 [Cryptotermes secundus]PNF15124.1 hypothetical protein B7P43_G15566 [Cryptotermes secundus]